MISGDHEMKYSDFEFLTSYLKKVTDLRKDNTRVRELLEMEDMLSEPLQDVTSEIVKKILDDYSPEAMDYFAAALGVGDLKLMNEIGRSKE